MEVASSGKTPSRPEQVALRVLRIEPGKSLHARMLSARVGGCFTHWVKGRSVYCDANGCCTGVKRPDRFWKGYVAAEVYEVTVKKWIPWCLEITEHLELDLRGRYARGQVWRIFRLPSDGKKRQAVQGTLVEELDPARIPIAFPIVPVLRTIFHCEVVELDKANPTPDRVVLEPSEGEPPPGIGTRSQAERPATKQEWDELRRNANRGGRHETANGNGRKS